MGPRWIPWGEAGIPQECVPDGKITVQGAAGPGAGGSGRRALAH
ncbi:MAG: hypothetical protein OXU25_01475 [Thaumarchaeota archaeon]|nr:hypothetical protein [Nitrososphaerota archaeon]